LLGALVFDVSDSLSMLDLVDAFLVSIKCFTDEISPNDLKVFSFICADIHRILRPLAGHRVQLI
jgi:hypothetical protein